MGERTESEEVAVAAHRAGAADASGEARVPQEEAPVPVRLRHLHTLAGWAVGLFLFFYFFRAFELLFLCLLGSAILAATLQPLAHRIPAKRWPSAVLAGLVPILGAAALFWLVGWLLWRVVHEQAGQWPALQASIDEMLAGWSRTLGLPDALSIESLRVRLAAVLTGGGRGGGSEKVMAAAGAVATALVALVLVLFGAMFLLGERERTLLRPVLRLLPPRRRPQIEEAICSLGPKLRWWLAGSLVSMAVTGAASAIGFRLAGMQFALPLGILAGFSELVPTFGPTFVFLVALLVAATQGSAVVVKVLIVWAVVQTLESYILQPTVMKRAVEIPPLVTLFSVIFWGKVFGLAGLLLAVPLDLVVWTFATHLLAERDEQPTPAGRGP
jgi:predicted PurR-regulated permease PerM